MRSFLRLASAGLVTAGLSLSPALSTPAMACGDKTTQPGKAVPADAAKVVLAVEGMSCGGCANSIKNAVLALTGVYDAEVSYESGQAVVHYDAKATTVDTISQAIDKAGYKVAKVVQPGA